MAVQVSHWLPSSALAKHRQLYTWASILEATLFGVGLKGIQNDNHQFWVPPILRHVRAFVQAQSQRTGQHLGGGEPHLQSDRFCFGNPWTVMEMPSLT